MSIPVGAACWLMVFEEPGQPGGCCPAHVIARDLESLDIAVMSDSTHLILPSHVSGLDPNGGSRALECLGGRVAAVFASSTEPTPAEQPEPAPAGWKWSDPGVTPDRIVASFRQEAEALLQCIQAKPEQSVESTVQLTEEDLWAARERELGRLQGNPGLIPGTPPNPASPEYSINTLLSSKKALADAERVTDQLHEAIELAKNLRNLSMVELDQERQRNAALRQQIRDKSTHDSGPKESEEQLRMERDAACAEVQSLQTISAALLKDISVVQQVAASQKQAR